MNRLYQIERLTDLGGVLRSITSEFQLTTNSGTSMMKRELNVETDSHGTVVLSLWADQRKLIDESILEIFSKAPSIVVTSLTVATYGRTFTFNSTKATKIYLDINNFKLKEITDRIKGDEDKKIAYIDKSGARTNEDNVKIDCTIAQLLSDVRSGEYRGKIYAVPATIVKLKNSSSWSYLACPFYKSVARLDGTQYFCSRCHKMTDNPKSRYRLNVDILDSTTSTTITVFDKEAECLIGQKVEDMLIIFKAENGAQKIENIFHQLSGNKAVFQFKPNNYKMNNPGSLLTVKKFSKHPTMPKPDTLHSQITPPSDQSSIVELRTPSSKISSQMDTDLKGKTKLVQDVDNGSDHLFNASRTEPTKKILRRGIVINDNDDLHNTQSSVGTKLRDKRQKK